VRGVSDSKWDSYRIHLRGFPLDIQHHQQHLMARLAIYVIHFHLRLLLFSDFKCACYSKGPGDWNRSTKRSAVIHTRTNSFAASISASNSIHKSFFLSRTLTTKNSISFWEHSISFREHFNSRRLLISHVNRNTGSILAFSLTHNRRHCFNQVEIIKLPSAPSSSLLCSRKSPSI
jgi:hypothetical protein